MRFVRFQPYPQAPYVALGLETERGILDLRATAERLYVNRAGDAATLSATLFPADLKSFLELGMVGLTAARELFGAIRGGEAIFYDPQSVKLLAPLKKPGKLVAVGLNYIDHADESKMEIPKQPIFFTKYASSITGPRDPIIIPKITRKLDYEVELAVVIGQRCHNVSSEEAWEYLFGYTVLNDVSARDLQLELGGQWVAGKSCDTFTPLGPSIVTRDEITDIAKLQLKLWVNGELRQDRSAGDMHFSIGQIVSYLSGLFTLEPGDIIATGTPPGVGLGFNPPRYLKAGDIVKAQIDGIGVLENTVENE